MSAPAAASEATRRRALSRALTGIENGTPFQAVTPGAGHRSATHVIGITGAPGAGKSTLTSALVGVLRTVDRRVAVLAIDPSSPLTGGAILGDRIRMGEHLHDPDVFIRSLATRGQSGGLASAIPAAIRELEAYGFDVVLIETVGVGQVEVDIAHAADTTIVVMNPGWGDDIQASKAGLLEIADIFVVNKADRPGAQETVRELNGALDLAGPASWRVPVKTCTATSGEGVQDVWEAVSQHVRYLGESGQLEVRRRNRRLQALRDAALEFAEAWAVKRLASVRGDEISCLVADGQLEPQVAASQLMRLTHEDALDCK